MASRFLSLVLVVATIVVSAPPAGAQTDDLALEVVAQPLWHTRNDPLGLSIRLTNDGTAPVTGYIATVTAHGRVLSRSSLHASFDSPATFEASSITAIDARDEEIAPGAEITRTIDEPVEALQSLALASESGVYPVTISVFDGAGSQLATTSTLLIYYPSRPEFRLPAVPIVPLADLPRRGPEGAFSSEADGSFPLESATARGGWLSGLIAALENASQLRRSSEPRGRGGRGRDPKPPPPPPEPLHAAVVVMPRLAEELSDMADGFRRDEERVGATSEAATSAEAALERVRAVAARRWIQPVLAPYSFPDLPTLFDRFETTPGLAAAHTEDHLREAETVLTAALGEAPARDWIYTPAGRLDNDSLEELQARRAARFTFFAEESLDPLEDPAGGGCPEPPLSFTCPVTVPTSVTRATGFVLDSALQERLSELARSDSPRAALQRFFAELSMIREEVPSRTDRVVAIGLPGLWEPPPWLSRSLLTGLRDAPWLQTFTPREALGFVGEQVEPTERRIRSVVPPLLNEPDDGYLGNVARADEVIDAFREIQPPPSLLQRLTRNALVSESRLWWSDVTALSDGETYATDAAAEAERELDKISVGGSTEIALTSREAPMPVTVFNDAAYDVSVTARITSSDLRLNETFLMTVPANGLREVTVDVAAQSSGIFTVFVTIETPDGYEIDDREVTIRSTEFNEIALGLTFGALAFLVLFYVTRAVRGRRERTREGTA